MFSVRRCIPRLLSAQNVPSIADFTNSTKRMDVHHKCKELIPPLSETSHKGSCGRVGVFGGSAEFTGAPYFAGISALRTGADLVYVFTASSAATVIKSYSPELMVMPYLDVENGVGLITPWLKRLHVVVIGPGLGRLGSTFNVILQIIKILKTLKNEEGEALPIIFDADGLYFLIRNLDVLREYPGGIYITPNRIEFANMASSILGNGNNDPVEKQLQLITEEYGNKLTIILKWNVDRICCGNKYLECSVIGSARRCGGQGDILSGILATFAIWAQDFKRKHHSEIPDMYPETMLAGYAACCMTRTCNRLAFDKMSRSTLATDMILEIPKSFKFLFE